METMWYILSTDYFWAMGENRFVIFEVCIWCKLMRKFESLKGPIMICHSEIASLFSLIFFQAAPKLAKKNLYVRE